MNHQFQDLLSDSRIVLDMRRTQGLPGLAKNLLDRIFAVAALLVFSPLMIAIAIAIKIESRGPVFFKQPRLGRDGKIFVILKYRSMRVHQETDGVTQATVGDTRITRLGGFLRRTSLDEIPQFINVLFGDMSVVGPRPHALAHNDFYSSKVDGYMLRHLVKPGITGWAQINGFRGETDVLEKMARRVEFDLYYIRNWTFMMDVKIIWRTAWRGWKGANAY